MPKKARSAQSCRLPNLNKFYHQVFFGTPCVSGVWYPGFLIEWIFYWIESSQIKNFESIFELNIPEKKIIEYFFELNIPEKNDIE